VEFAGDLVGAEGEAVPVVGEICGEHLSRMTEIPCGC
jgi:hypothetical protein